MALEISAVKVEANEDDRLKILFNAMCNGWNEMLHFGLECDYDGDHYAAARDALIAAGKTEKELCFEDILIQLVRDGKSITVYDIEEDEEPQPVGYLSLATLNANWDKVPPRILLSYINEEDDAWTAVDFMQAISMGEITRG